jgi:hypothetical protein
VTTFRVSRAGAAASPSRFPQNGQNANAPETSLPQPAQVATPRVYDGM